MKAIALLMWVGVSLPAWALEVELNDAQGFSQRQTQLLNQAVVAVNQVINSENFKQSVLNHTYQGKKQFVQSDGLDNEQVYQKIMEAAEIYPKVSPVDGLMDMTLQVYWPRWRWSSAVAYTNWNTATLFISGRYLGWAKVSDLANTIVHEWVHKLGFEHDYNSTARRPYSVPYAIGDIVGDLVSQINSN